MAATAPAAPPAGVAPVDLSAARHRRSPADALRDAADACAALGVAQYDTYGDGGATPDASWLRRFELEVAADLGKPDALFLPSGVMAQQVALLVHARGRRPSAFVAHHSSHLLLHEHDAPMRLSGLEVVVVPADAGAASQAPLAHADVEAALRRAAAAAAAAPVHTVVLELPHRELGGKCTPYADVVALAAACRRDGIALHMDGARLWEAAAGYAVPRAELCSHFDSVYVSFYKGLGAFSGAALAGDAAFVAEARVWARRFGGNLYTQAPVAVAAWAGFRAHRAPADFVARRDRLRAIVALLTHEAAAAAAGGSAAAARPLLRFDPPVPEVPMVHVYVRATAAAATAARDAAAAATGITCFARIRGEGAHGAAGECYTELNLGPANAGLPDDAWVRGWRALLAALVVQPGQ